MTRRQLLTLLAAPHRVGYREYAKCLPDYLHDLAERAYQTRNHAIGRLASGNAIRERQRWVRDTFWKLVGGMPERTPLNPRTMGALERPGYRLEKTGYETVPPFHN